MTAEAFVRAVQGAHDALYTSAREHKRLSYEHRRRARETMERLNALQEFCSAAGITLRINESVGKSHGKRPPARPIHPRA